MSKHRSQFGTDLNYKCCLCNELSESADSLEAHLASLHIMYFAYECEYCKDALFPTDHTLREHYANVHHKKIFTIKYKVSPELDERRRALKKLVAQSTSTDSNINSRWQQQSAQNSFTSQLLQNCTALLHNQLLSTNEFLAKREVENNDSFKEEDLPSNSTGHNIEAANSILMEDEHCFLLQPNLLELHTPKHGALEIGQNYANFNPLETSSTASASPIKKSKKRRSKDNNAETKLTSADIVNDEIKGESAKHKGPMVECPGCNRMVGRYRNSMLIHVSTHHCSLPIFECLVDGCGKKWYSISARTKEHIESKHGGDSSLLKDNRRELLPELRSTALQLFPGVY